MLLTTEPSLQPQDPSFDLQNPQSPRKMFPQIVLGLPWTNAPLVSSKAWTVLLQSCLCTISHSDTVTWTKFVPTAWEPLQLLLFYTIIQLLFWEQRGIVTVIHLPLPLHTRNSQRQRTLAFSCLRSITLIKLRTYRGRSKVCWFEVERRSTSTGTLIAHSSTWSPSIALDHSIHQKLPGAPKNR